jgi:peptide/nickel transport system permease protein
LREREFIPLREHSGGDARILMTHLFNMLPILLVITGIDMGGVILIESAPSFGSFSPTASQKHAYQRSVLFFRVHGLSGPGICISITVLCLYLIGDGSRDALDPRLRGS